jgi:hypothetical protein
MQLCAYGHHAAVAIMPGVDEVDMRDVDIKFAR